MTGKSQSEAVATLRSTKLGSDVTLIISRQVQVENSTDEVEKSPVNNVSGIYIYIYMKNKRTTVLIETIYGSPFSLKSRSNLFLIF